MVQVLQIHRLDQKQARPVSCQGLISSFHEHWGTSTFYVPRAFLSTSYHLMGSSPFFLKYSLALRKWPHPKKPLYAERGLGWGA